MFQILIFTLLNFQSIQVRSSPSNIALVQPESVLSNVTQAVINDACWLNNYTRGNGTHVDSCPANHEKSGWLCYPLCPDGYKGVGPVCWRRNSSVSGKLMIGRGIGKRFTCNQDQEYDDGLCYPKCSKNFTGDGSLCWQQCPFEMPHKCGRICTKTHLGCSLELLKASMSGFNVVYGIGALGGVLLAGAATTGLGALAAVFGVISGLGGIGVGTLSALIRLSSYPFCPGSIQNKEEVRRSVDEAVRQLKTHLDKSYQAG